jgi:lipopolysaccharide/colanic/teichoic acid biosynthesis glycosyltransferase
MFALLADVTVTIAAFPIIIDSRPAYLGAEAGQSLALMPVGRRTLLQCLTDAIGSVTTRQPTIVRGFDADPIYDERLRSSAVVSTTSVAAADFAARVSRYEPSDWLLIVDARYLPLDGLDLAPLLDGLEEHPSFARHLVALARTIAGTNERVELDAERRVRRVQRYYDPVTWTVASGVCGSMVPISSLALLPTRRFDSLSALRRSLVAHVPSRDVPVRGGVADLESEAALLALNERHLAIDARAGLSGPARLHPGARVTGSVVLHPGASIDEGATVVGPATLGEGARIERGALVAQSVLAPGTVIPARAIVRHRVVTNGRILAPAAPSAEESELPPLVERITRRRRIYPAVKTAIEALIAVVALIILAPILAAVAIAVKIDSPGPIFYGDPREAKGGRLFRCYKFRTMRVGAAINQRELAASNQMDGPQFKIDVDPRVTRVGRFLRRTSLDELPQLLNVARGQMSLVGPRPSPFRENQMCVPWREARLSVRPGITGLWQVCRHQREAGDFHQWIYYDIQYVRHMSFLVDLRIIAATLWTMGGKSHVPLSWIISSPSEEAI